MAISTYQTYLMKKTGNAFAKALDITEYPDMGSDPNLLPTTTLSDRMETHIFGIITNDGVVFAANYDWATYQSLKELENANTEVEWALYVGANSSGEPDGHDGKFTWKGYPHVHLTGGGVNEVRSMRILIANTTEIKEITE